MIDPDEDPERRADKQTARRAVWVGVAAGALYGLFMRLLSENSKEFGDYFLVMTASFMLGVPLLVGYLTVLPRRRPSLPYAIFMPWLPTLLCVAISAAIGLEGAICIVMGLPAMLLLASTGGLFARTDWGRRKGFAGLAACLPLALAPIEGQIPLPRSARIVETSIEIEASPAAIWREIVSVRPILPEERRPALFTAIGFPAPISAVIDHPGVGAVRQARFEGGVLFLEAVTVWEPERELAFTIDAQTEAIPPATLDPHVTIGGAYFDVLEGTYRIEPLAAGRSRLELLSRTRVSTHFNFYAGAWSDAVMRSIQRNILEIVRARAERSSRATERAR